MRSAYFWILFFYLIGAVASETTFEIWGAGKIYYTFYIDSGTQSLVSANCKEPKKTCKALQAKKNPVKADFSEKELSGGKNPSSLVCTKKHHGEILILKNAKGNENSFCKFADHSMISANDLDH